ncbi:hypothetical protein ACFFRR_008192 [Megaselia abdita]
MHRFVRRFRYLLKMALTVSLRKFLFLLLSITAFIVFVFYWSQTTLKPPSIITTFENSLKTRVNQDHFSIPTEKTWTYKCESDKCVRYHYLTETNGEKRVPFMTCSMTCGDVNVWPHPTRRVGVLSSSLKFSVESLQLKMSTSFHEVDRLYRKSFHVFLRELKQIQKIEFFDHAKVAENERQSFNPEDKVKPSKCVKSHCDIINFIVEVHVLKSGNVHIDLETDESYNLTSTLDNNNMVAKITANTFFGARHGLSTLQQLIWYDEEDDLLRILSRFVINDAPKFKYRGLMLDTSRNYFSVDSIKRTLAGMSYAKLNRFHWHLTDSQSFPFVSKYYPELAAYGAYSDRETYTHEDVQEVVEYAKIRGIQVIPEIDAPAHAGNGWEWGPKKGLGDLSLCINQQPWKFYCGEPPCGQLNPKNNNTYLILQKLYEELLNLTGPTDYFHLGGDEVNLECWGQYFNETDLRGLWCDFMLQVMNRLKIANKNVMPKFVGVWSSGLTSTRCLPKSQVAVQVWGGSTWTENYDLIENGFNVIISHVDAWYLDCGFGSWRQTGDAACSPYRTWQNVYKHKPWEKMRLDGMRKKQVLGGEVCLWTEQVDENGLDNRLWPRTAALGERLWTDPDDDNSLDPIPREVFIRMSVFRNRLVELGLKAEPMFPKYCQQNPGECE